VLVLVPEVLVVVVLSPIFFITLILISSHICLLYLFRLEYQFLSWIILKFTRNSAFHCQNEFNCIDIHFESSENIKSRNQVFDYIASSVH